jgi:hypothetical protein
LRPDPPPAPVEAEAAGFGVDAREPPQGLIDPTAAERYDFSDLSDFPSGGVSIFRGRRSKRPPCLLDQSSEVVTLVRMLSGTCLLA